MKTIHYLGEFEGIRQNSNSREYTLALPNLVWQRQAYVPGLATIVKFKNLLYETVFYEIICTGLYYEIWRNLGSGVIN